MALKALGFSLDHIRRMIEDPVDEAELRGMLVLRRAQIENDLAKAASRITELESRIHHLDKEHHDRRHPHQDRSGHHLRRSSRGWL